MTNERPDIPRELEREVLMEAGHRCAIPTCKQTPIEIAHIIPYSEVKCHTFENLIALCPTCHTRYDKREIDRKSMKLYKAKLSIINSKYGDLEKRIFEYFAKNPKISEVAFAASKENEIHLMYALKDGLIRLVREEPGSGRDFYGTYTQAVYEITQEGKEFIKKWIDPNATVIPDSKTLNERYEHRCIICGRPDEYAGIDYDTGARKYVCHNCNNYTHVH